jgi:hypothetical protein
MGAIKSAGQCLENGSISCNRASLFRARECIFSGYPSTELRFCSFFIGFPLSPIGHSCHFFPPFTHLSTLQIHAQQDNVYLHISFMCCNRRAYLTTFSTHCSFTQLAVLISPTTLSISSTLELEGVLIVVCTMLCKSLQITILYFSILLHSK